MKLIHLFEKRRNPESNVKRDRIDILGQYSTRKDIFIHFTDINKIGINPRTEFHTPAGIYTYPLRESWKPYIVRGKFPFASNRKLVFILKSKAPVIDLVDDYSMANWTSDKKKLISKYKSQRFQLNEDTEVWNRFVEYAIRNGIDPESYLPWNLSIEQLVFIGSVTAVPRKFPSTKMWNATRLIAMGNGQHDPNVSVWNKILRTLGYKALSDRKGKGIIHPNEPIQTIFLEKSALEVIDVIENR